MGTGGNGNEVLSWEQVGMGMGMTSWECEGLGTVKVIPAHLYFLYFSVFRQSRQLIDY